jgi:flavin reductase
MSELTPFQASFRQAMSRLGAAVTLLTTDGPAGRHGMTASAVCSVTDNPPMLLVCVNKTARSHDLFLRNGVIGVNVLAGGHEELSGRFAKFSEEDRFSYSGWQSLKTGVPLLNDALTAFECRIVDRAEKGTHSVFFCEVTGILPGAAVSGLVWFGRSYHQLPVSI